MCGRSSLTKTEKELEERFDATFYSEDLERYNPLPNFNVAPTHMHPVITNQDPKHLQLFQWGLIPFWSKSAGIGSKMINARIESILDKPAFRQAIQKRRCLVPLDGFYEWKKDGKEKIPYRITMQDDSVFCAAGIWEKWANSQGEIIYSFSILTQEPNELMKDIHNRMPAILLPEQEHLWLDPSISAKESVSLISPYPSTQMKAYRVSKRVNRVAENDADLIKEQKSNGPIQGSLF